MLDLTAAMAAYQAGHVDGLETLWTALQRDLYWYLHSFTPRDPWAAEDLLQETFLQIHRSRHTYTPPRPVRRWAFGVARHVGLMHVRRARRNREHLAKDHLPELPVPPSSHEVEALLTLGCLLACIPQAERLPVVLHHLHGLTFAEVGVALGISPGAARKRACLGLRRAREAACA